MEFQLSFSNVRCNKTLTINSKRGIELINFNASFYVLSNLFFFLCNKTIFVNLLKRKLKNIAFFPFYIIISLVKRIYPSKIFLHYNPLFNYLYSLGVLVAPLSRPSFLFFLFFLSFLCRFSLPFPAFINRIFTCLLRRLPNRLKLFLQIR